MSAAAGDVAVAIPLYSSILEDNIKSETMVADAIAWLVEHDASAPQYRDAIAQARLVSLLVRAYTAHKESARIAGHVAAVIARLVPIDAHRKQFVAADGVALVVSLLSAHGRLADVAAASARIVVELTRPAASLASLVSAGVVRPLVACLRAHTADVAAAVPLCGALAELCLGTEQSGRDAVTAAGGLAVVMAVARAHQHVEAMAVPLANALFALSPAEGQGLQRRRLASSRSWWRCWKSLACCPTSPTRAAMGCVTSPATTTRFGQPSARLGLCRTL